MKTLFTYPQALWLLALLPVVLGLWLWSWQRRQGALKQLGLPTALAALVRQRPQARLWRGVCLGAGLLLLVLACAGPQWGRERRPQAVAGRDLVIVLDLSRSMLAEQPSRQERALRALHDLADTLELRGGHRVALVIFAAHPQVVFPLTPDYDHLRSALAQLEADHLPPELRPTAAGGERSGTRIGAALELAVHSHEPRFQGAQDILLLSDGDDPGGDDEWALGAALARRQRIPVHTIGIGDPVNASFIPAEEGFLRYQHQLVSTRLQERPLQEIARRTDGVYLPAHTKALPLGKLFREVLSPRGRRADSDVEGTAGLPLYRQRAPWFLALAFFLLAASMLIADGPTSPEVTSAQRGQEPRAKSQEPRAKSQEPRAKSQGQNLGPRFFSGNLQSAICNLQSVLAALALLTLAAAPLPPVAQLLRQGQAAFDQEHYEAALHEYLQAEEAAADPGLVAFNKAATLYRLGRYRQAELHYRRCLDDQQIPPQRQARAWYDLGNCLLRQGQPDEVRFLEAAIDCYRQTLDLEEDQTRLRADAEYNLELARLFWLKARAAGKKTPENQEASLGPQQKEKKNRKTPGKNSSPNGQSAQEGDPKIASNGQPKQAGPNQKKRVSAGPLQVLPDADELVILSPEDAAAFLEQAATRILGERRLYRRQAAGLSPTAKDW